jgi:hypothetical protein
MKRILVLLSVVALLVVMMVVTVAPAFAAGFGKELNRSWHGEGDWGVGN